VIAYFNGRFVEREAVRVSPDDRGFLFADGVYEVVRVYGGRPFALPEHGRRLGRSLSALRLDWPDAPRLEAIVTRLIADNGLASRDALVYLQITRGAAPRRHAFPEPATPPTAYVAVTPWRAREDLARGVSAVLVPDVRWARCDIKSIALLPNVLANQRAHEAGAEEAVFVRDGVVTEGTHTNVCVVRDGTLVTHPLTNHVLPGITRAEVLALCRAAGLPCLEAPVVADDLERVDEVLLVGTTVEVTAVTRLDGRLLGDGRPGPVARRLAAAFNAHVAARCRGAAGADGV